MALITEEARAWSRRPLPDHTVTVGRTDIIRYARAIGESNPIHLDPDAAVAAGHPDIVAPPYFPYAIRVQAATLEGDLEEDGSAPGDVPPITARRAMAGETEIEFGSEVHAGDTITLERKIVDFYEKEGRSGPLVFVTTEFTFSNHDGALVMRERFTRIYR